MFCHKCGTKLADDAGFCHKCGTKTTSSNTVSQVPTPQVQASPIIPDRRQQSVIGLCKCVFALRLIDAIVWTLILIIQIFGDIGFWKIIWNVIATILCYVYAMRLFGVISSNKFNSVRVSRVVEDNVGLAIIGGIFYGWQFFSEGILIMLLFIGLEIVILVVGGIAFFSARQIRKETTPNKEMTVRLEQGELVVLNGKCTRNISHNKRVFSYNGVGTLTTKHFIFTSNAGNTHEWAVDTYGESAPFHLMTDVIIPLADITNVSNAKKSVLTNDNIKTLVIQTKVGTSYTFLFEVTIKDSWTNPNKWHDAFQKAIAEAKCLIDVSK